VVLETDPRRVRQILLNLLSNAIKFGHGKPIEVRTRRRETWLEIAVTDHGPGISDDDLPRIFDEFVQLEHAARSHADTRQTGTGLGLPISKRLADLLGGSLVAESTLGEGSTFRLCIPLDRVHDRPAELRQAAGRADAPPPAPLPPPPTQAAAPGLRREEEPAEAGARLAAPAHRH
jgi:signal transduction histidine kinase